MSMHAKTDSEVTSLAPSSPNRPVYYVQSPSRDSHDGEKTTNSFHSTPVLSPMGSPGRHSRESSSTRFSGSLKPGSGKGGDGSRGRHNHRKSEKQWKEFDAIEEEGLLDDDGTYNGIPRRCYFVAFVVGFFVLFSFFALILWGASRNQKPIIIMKSISYDQFIIQSGSDSTGVATDMASMNSTVKLIFHNKGTFFGVHVTFLPLDIFYSQLTVATGTSISYDQFIIQSGSDSTGVATDMASMNSTVKLIFHNKGTFFGVHVTFLPLDIFYSQLTVATGTNHL
ncbi:unnamed protein product [Ilex paraguariensis]|uniref:Late embryogenesis abundant protein LEA-2 subgroup domain-containing protein n=1 Tax=Ilex paraguariensis TaxID=185542 RepID=A0ABC8UD49_9AQUA